MWKTKKQLQSTPAYYPPGTFIHTDEGYYYIMSDVKRVRFITTRVLESWSPPRVVETTEAAVAKYRCSSKMGFRSGTLLNNIADGRLYLVSDNKLRHVVSPDVITRLDLDKAIKVSQAEIDLHEMGSDLN